MKKIFTFAAAILASVSLMAAEPNYGSYDWGADDFATVFANHDGIVLSSDASAWKGNFSGIQYVALGGGTDMSAASPTPYFGITADAPIDSIEVFWAPNGTNNTSVAWAGWEEASELLNQTVVAMGKTETYKATKSYDDAIWQKIDLSGYDFKAVMLARQIKKAIIDGQQQSNLGDNQTVNILGIRVWISNAAPSTDPVTSVNISGPTEGYVGQTVTFTATTDAKADTLFWTVDGAVQESHTKTLTLALNGERTYQVACWARNQYNTAEDWAVGQLSIVSTVKPVLEQVVVTDHTTWDFSKAATVSQIKWENELKDATPVVMANIDGMNNDANFNSQALLFSGEYPIRDGKYCQGAHLSFQINSPGLLTIEYSNTGNRSIGDGETEGQEALRRFLTINGNLVAGDAGSMKSNTNTTTSGIAVEPGNVVISAVMPYSEDPTTAQYIRIYKVVYQRTGWPTAIENTENEVKAVKRIVNGVMVIEKNGMVYNAQGQIVK